MSEQMTPQELGVIAARVEAATKGPWGSHRDLAGVYTVQANPRVSLAEGMAHDGVVATVHPVDSDQEAYANVRFIASAREDVPALLARIAELETALAAVGRSLSSFIFDSDDPGVDALGAQWLYHQALPQADDPFAQPRAFRASVFEEAAKAALRVDIVTGDDHREHPQAYIEGHSAGVEDVADCLQALADEAVKGGEQR
jgi:hypothetical protein